MSDLGFWALAQESPDRPAVITPDGNELCAGELLGRANRVVHALARKGVGVGDVVATVLPNCVEMIEIYLAALQAGWYLVPINHHLVSSEIAYILRDSGAKAFICHERFADSCNEALSMAEMPSSTCICVGDLEGFESYRHLIGTESTELPSNREVGDVMNYTSGTTGNPKGVYRPLAGVTPEAAALSLAGILFLFGINPLDDNVHIVGSPLYHTAVMRFAGASLHFGHTLVLMDKWDAQEMLSLIERHRVTTSHMVPTQFHRLLALPEEIRSSYDLSSLRHMIHAAAPCPIEVKHRMIEWWGPVIDEYYAASEGGGTVVSTAEWLMRPGTVGKPWPISEIAIFDDSGVRINEPGVIGTVYISMQAGDFEYHHDKEKTQSNRLGKFFTVGDVGFLDKDGYLFLRDRLIDMIISGGVNIYPAEIEGVLLTHPKVADVAVFGIPNDDWGEEVLAVVEPVAGATGNDDLARELLDFCAAKVAKFKMPKTVEFIEEMPRDPNGKLYKRKLRDPYWVGVKRSV